MPSPIYISTAQFEGGQGEYEVPSGAIFKACCPGGAIFGYTHQMDIVGEVDYLVELVPDGSDSNTSHQLLQIGHLQSGQHLTPQLDVIDFTQPDEVDLSQPGEAALSHPDENQDWDYSLISKLRVENLEIEAFVHWDSVCANSRTETFDPSWTQLKHVKGHNMDINQLHSDVLQLRRHDSAILRAKKKFQDARQNLNYLKRRKTSKARSQATSSWISLAENRLMAERKALDKHRCRFRSRAQKMNEHLQSVNLVLGKWDRDCVEAALTLLSLGQGNSTAVV